LDSAVVAAVVLVLVLVLVLESAKVGE